MYILGKKLMSGTTLAALAVAGFAITMPSTAHAENAQSYMPPAEQIESQQDMKIPDEKMEQFVEAEQAVIDIKKDTNEELQKASSAEQKDHVHEAMNMKIEEALKQAGLSADEYNQIRVSIQTDPETKKQYTEMAG